jgi:hypothetical protein
MIRPLAAAAALATLLAIPAAAAPICEGAKMGFAGLLAKCNRGPDVNLTLASGKPLAEGPVTLQSGAYYRIFITADGSQELAIAGPEFFRAIWMDEIVINDIEVRPMAIDSIEFDAAGTARLSFVAIKPGRYDIRIPGTTGDTQRVEISIQ